MRIVLALLVLAACSNKSSAPEKKAEDRTGGPGNGGPPTPVATGSGSTPPADPGRETRIGSASNDVLAQQARIARGEPDAAMPTDLPPTLDGSGNSPPGKIVIASKTSFDNTNLTADAVADKITRSHLAALGNCYRQVLARDATIEGKATLSLTVKLDGKLSKTAATAPDAALQSCFTQAMQTWTFPVPKNKDGEATDASFQVALALAPR